MCFVIWNLVVFSCKGGLEIEVVRIFIGRIYVGSFIGLFENVGLVIDC